MLAVLEDVGFRFDEASGLDSVPALQNPIDVARRFLSGDLTQSEYEQEGRRWQERIAAFNYRDTSPLVLQARVGASLLGATRPELAGPELIEYFVEFLECLEYDIDAVERRLEAEPHILRD
jgi:hypothetical protein